MKNFHHKLLTIIAFIFVSLPYITVGQTGSGNAPVAPILLNKSALSGIGLKPVQLQNEPDRKFFQRRLLRGDDLSVYIVSSESWTTEMNNFPIDEVVMMLNGKAEIKPAKGSQMTFHSNQFFFIPKGYTGSWQIQAGTNFHYELSVISTERSAAADPKKTLPELISQDALSGIGIELNGNTIYEKVLTRGAELTVSLKAEKPTEKRLSDPMKEQLVNLISGQLILVDTNGSEHTFNTGDFFLVPKGFQGSWQSQGHGLIKYLTIEKTT